MQVKTQNNMTGCAEVRFKKLQVASICSGLTQMRVTYAHVLCKQDKFPCLWLIDPADQFFQVFVSFFWCFFFSNSLLNVKCSLCCWRLRRKGDVQCSCALHPDSEVGWVKETSATRGTNQWPLSTSVAPAQNLHNNFQVIPNFYPSPICSASPKASYRNTFLPAVSEQTGKHRLLFKPTFPSAEWIQRNPMLCTSLQLPPPQAKNNLQELFPWIE